MEKIALVIGGNKGYEITQSNTSDGIGRELLCQAFLSLFFRGGHWKRRKTPRPGFEPGYPCGNKLTDTFC
ncbi:MAG: hypothetical protein QT08_C0019G0018 [archaeon GW2011_AR17]|nr:MAG: hypothetical protein QT08_C0019G0018 [archaeon GW2011_AR17]